MGNAEEFIGQTAIVTGAAAGIGLSIAEHLANAGANVVLVDIDGNKGRTETNRLTDEGYSAMFQRGDVTDSQHISRSVARAMSQFGKIDILVNNAGGFFKAEPIMNIMEDEWNNMIALNLTSVFLFCKVVVPHMIAQRSGRIINISSMAGQTAQQPAPLYYSAAKAGVLGLTRNLALQLGQYNITVNAVSPSTTRSPRVDRVRGEEVYRTLEATTPLRRVGEPNDIASATMYLASSGASFITGEVLNVNGGRFMA